MTDSELRALLAGDEAAFLLFVEEWKGRVFKTCLSFVPNREEAEDLSQEIFILLWKAIRTFRGESSLKTWVYRIAMNCCLEYKRHGSRQKRKAHLTSLDKLTPSQQPHMQGHFDHPGYTLEQQDKARVLHQALSKLSENQRSALILHEVEELSYKEVAEVMDLSFSSVESLIFRAKTNLRKMLEDFYKNNLK